MIKLVLAYTWITDILAIGNCKDKKTCFGNNFVIYVHVFKWIVDSISSVLFVSKKDTNNDYRFIYHAASKTIETRDAS